MLGSLSQSELPWASCSELPLLPSQPAYHAATHKQSETAWEPSISLTKSHTSSSVHSQKVGVFPHQPYMNPLFTMIVDSAPIVKCVHLKFIEETMERKKKHRTIGYITLSPIIRYYYLNYFHSFYCSSILLPRSSATTPVRQSSMMPSGFINSINAVILFGSPVTSIHIASVV